jgi:hypothetical protein
MLKLLVRQNLVHVPYTSVTVGLTMCNCLMVNWPQSDVGTSTMIL